MIEESIEWQEVAKLEKSERDNQFQVVYTENGQFQNDDFGYNVNTIKEICRENNFEWVHFEENYKKVILIKNKMKVNKCSECGGTDLLIDSRKWYGLYCPFCEE